MKHMAFFLCCSQRVPEVNAQWTGEQVRLLGNIDVSVAVATDSGLITPIVRDAIGLGVEEISVTIKELAGRAREGKLKPEEFLGGSFTYVPELIHVKLGNISYSLYLFFAGLKKTKKLLTLKISLAR